MENLRTSLKIRKILVREFPCGEYDLPATFGERDDDGRCWTEVHDGRKEIWTDQHGEIQIVRSNGRTCTVLETVHV